MLVQNILDFFIYLMMFIILSQYYEQMIRHYSISTLNMQYQRKENPAYYIYPIGSCKKYLAPEFSQISKYSNVSDLTSKMHRNLFMYYQYVHPSTQVHRSSILRLTIRGVTHSCYLCVLSKREYHFCSLLDNLYLTSC